MTLTAGEVASMRATASIYLSGTAVIQSEAFTDDGGGGGTTAWTASGTVACRVAPLGTGQGEQVTADRVSPYANSVITLPFDAVVDETDRLLIAGRVYNIEAVRTRSDNLTTRVEAVKQT